MSRNANTPILRFAKSFLLAAIAAVISCAIMPSKKALESPLPYSAEAERAVLGAAVLNPDAALEVIPVLRETDFFLPQNRVIYREVERLAASGQAIDGITLYTALENSGQLEAAGGAGYISALTDGLPRKSNVGAYAKTVKEKARLRSLVYLCEEVSAKAQANSDAGEIVEGAVEKILSLMADGQGDAKIIEWNEAAESAMRELEAVRANPGSIFRLNSGITKLDDTLSGLRKKEITLIVGGTSHGKAQPLDAQILTPTGYREMRSIKPGDEVIGKNGLPTKVMDVYPQGTMTVYRVTFSDGSSAECTEDHLWDVRTRKDKYRGRPFRTMTLREIVDQKTQNWFIPLCGQVEFPIIRHTIDPYVMGILLGDGGLTVGTPSVTIGDDSVLREFSNRLVAGVTPKRHGKMGYYLTAAVRSRKFGKRGNPLALALRGFGLYGKKANHKFIPESYLLSCFTQRELLLQGLMDSDGTVSKFGDENGHSVEFSSTSKKLAEDVIFLVRSLGGTARPYAKQSSFTYKGVKKKGLPSTRVLINLPSHIRPFRCEKKMAAYRPETKRPPNRSILSVERVGEKECQCIRVENSDGLYLTNDFIVTHNSLLAEEFAIDGDTNNYKGQIFSAEMSAESIALRQLAYEADVFFYHTRKPEHMSEEQMAALRLASKRERSLSIVDSGITPARVWAIAEARKRTRGLDFVIVDYDQLVIGAGMGKSADPDMFYAKQGDFIMKAAEFAKRLDVAFILLAQPRKMPPGMKKGEKPTLDDIYGHSAMRNTPHVIMWVVREYFVHGLDPKYERKAKVYVLKSRNDRTGMAKMEFDPQRVRLLNAAADAETEE